MFAAQRYAVEVVVAGRLYDEAHAAALADAEKSGRVIISASEPGRRLIDRMLRVTEDEIRSAIRFLLARHHRLAVEGSGNEHLIFIGFKSW